MKHQHKALASLIAGLLGTTLAHNALAIGTIDLNAAKADLYSSEMSNPEISINTAYVTKLNGSDPALGDTDVAVFAGKTSYVRIDFDNATISTDATVQLGGVGTDVGTATSNFITGTSTISCTTSRAKAEAVLQAITINLTSWLVKN